MECFDIRRFRSHPTSPLRQNSILPSLWALTVVIVPAMSVVLPSDSNWVSANAGGDPFWTRHDISIRAVRVLGSLNDTTKVLIPAGADAYSLPVALTGDPSESNVKLTFTSTGVTLYGGTFPVPDDVSKLSLLYSIDSGAPQVSPLELKCCDNKLLEVANLSAGQHVLTTWVDFVTPNLITSGVWIYNATLTGASPSSSTSGSASSTTAGSTTTSSTGSVSSLSGSSTTQPQTASTTTTGTSPSASTPAASAERLAGLSVFSGVVILLAMFGLAM
ncbi:hypothetical protein BKA62DRAFT_754192 [Auriculariales sp. MPI-PUGE-AT-0066]|nr:hypothetical protein BKA62DRAFT_754192 [Auriculariales sp. MPI-PUGE-AT-0066]